MARNLPSDLSTELQADYNSPVLLLEIQTGASSYLRLTTVTSDVSSNGHTWLGNSLLAGVSQVEEVSDERATQLQVKLLGDESTRSVVFNLLQKYTGKLYLSFFTGNRSLVTPICLFSGYFDTYSFNDSDKGSEVLLTFETEWVRLDRYTQRKYSDADQRAIYPDDAGFAFVSKYADWSKYWGRPEKKS